VPIYGPTLISTAPAHGSECNRPENQLKIEILNHRRVFMDRFVSEKAQQGNSARWNSNCLFIIVSLTTEAF
jgi:hypothetical protein